VSHKAHYEFYISLNTYHFALFLLFQVSFIVDRRLDRVVQLVQQRIENICRPEEPWNVGGTLRAPFFETLIRGLHASNLIT